MATSALDRTFRDVMNLSLEDRCSLMDRLAATLDCEWSHEVERRVADHEAGRTHSLDSADVHARLRAEIAGE